MTTASRQRVSIVGPLGQPALAAGRTGGPRSGGLGVPAETRSLRSVFVGFSSAEASR